MCVNIYANFKGGFMANKQELDIQSLALKMFNGDMFAKEQIINYYIKYIIKIIETNFSDFDCNIEEIKEEMIKILYESINTYKNEKEEYFSHYITRKLHQYFSNELRKLKNKKEYKNREIQELAMKMINGDNSARDKIIEFYSYHIKKLVETKYSCVNCDKEDLIQVGIIGLLKAINAYQKNQNHHFCSYANTYINNQIDSEIDALTSKEKYIGLNNNYNKKMFDDFIREVEVRTSILKLPRIKQEILYLYLWLNYSFDQIGLIYGFSGQNAYLHYKKALKLLKNELYNQDSTTKKL